MDGWMDVTSSELIHFIMSHDLNSIAEHHV